jgi:hypothetical protein
MKLSEVTSLPCVTLPFLTVQFSRCSNCIIWIQIICDSLRCLLNITNVTTQKNGILEGVVIEYTPTRVPWAEIKRISSLQVNYISFALIQYPNTHHVTLHAQTARPYTCCIKRKSNTCAFLGYYSASSGNTLPTFWNNLSVPTSRIKNPRPRFQDS